MPDLLLNQFDQEIEVKYRGECYLVRDNGAVLRRSRTGARSRKLDEIWTFGSASRSTGYMTFADHVVHQVVATAFHGAQPSEKHIVDHLDTNKRNNRPENLRWLTRLENILLNPITLRRIIIAFGSLDAFFENPQAQSVQNFDWMRTVSKEEASQSKERLLRWAESGKVPKGGELTDWVFENKKQSSGAEQEKVESASQTAGAIQRHWRTLTLFPLCPDAVADHAIRSYSERLHFGSVFAKNNYGESKVVVFDSSDSGGLLILTHADSATKNWALANV